MNSSDSNPVDELDIPVYCIKCSNFTANKDPMVVKRETHHLKALCVVCNSKKNKFLKRNRQITTVNSEPDFVNPDAPK